VNLAATGRLERKLRISEEKRQECAQANLRQDSRKRKRFSETRMIEKEGGEARAKTDFSAQAGEGVA